MYRENICKFITTKDQEQLIATNFIFEGAVPYSGEHRSLNKHVLYLVADGEGVFACNDRSHQLVPGMLFFTMADIPFMIENTKQLQYYYITFHGDSDFFVIKEFFDCIREGRQPEFDAYFATTCASVGILGHRSLMEKGVPYDIPDFRKEEDRLKYENDHETPFYGADGSEPTIPCCSNPDYRPTHVQYQKYLELYEA